MTRHVAINPFVLSVVVVLGGFAHCGVARGQEAARYAIIDIGDPGGRGSTSLDAINNNGVVVGRTWDATSNDIIVFRWRNGAFEYLEPPVPGLDARGNDINDSDEVAGRAVVAINTIHAVLWLADGTPVDLGTLGGEDSEAHGINELSEIIGQSDLPDFGFHAFLWRDGMMIDLGDLGVPGSSANAINNLGQIVGRSFRSEGPAHRAFLWENGEMINLGTFPNGGQSMANDINDAGLIVGSASGHDGRTYAVIWENQAIRSIHGLGLETTAYAINESGQVVGFADIDGEFDHISGFLYEPGGRMVDVMSLIPPRHRWRQILNVSDINDAGEIVAYGDRIGGSNGDYRGVLLTPVHPTLTLQGPQPGNAGTINGLRLTGCTPGARVRFYYSTVGGGTLIPGCHHTDGVTLQLEDPIFAGAATANQNGVATLTRFIPPAAQGRTFLIQALVQSECAISQLVVHQFE
ncbi:MAG: DUF3466 family protein [Phycisphaerales bacterium]|nr:DUF3466 family protein [Phycisphaerales bacterium]